LLTGETLGIVLLWDTDVNHVESKIGALFYVVKKVMAASFSLDSPQVGE
jgi:hypothetical protein